MATKPAIYLADGRRVETVSTTWYTPLILPLPGQPPVISVRYDTEQRFGELTFRDNIPVRYDFRDGYFSLYNDSLAVPILHPYVYIKDYLGSVRLTVDAIANNNGTGNARQGMEYLPSGAVFRSTNYAFQPRRFCEKELVMMHGWNMYDSQARYQYSLLPRFSTMDPLAEKYYSLSPYNYAGNDFVNKIDPDGRAPGDWFATMDAAAIDFGLMFNDNSIRENREYASTIFEVVNDLGISGYTYSIPSIGSSVGVNPSPAPDGMTAKAYVHTHGRYTPDTDSSYMRNNEFTGLRDKNNIIKNAAELKKTPNYDIGYANRKKIDAYVATPNGSLQRYSHLTGRVSTISYIMPSDCNDPTRKNVVSTFERDPVNHQKLIQIVFNLEKLLRQTKNNNAK